MKHDLHQFWFVVVYKRQGNPVFSDSRPYIFTSEDEANRVARVLETKGRAKFAVAQVELVPVIHPGQRTVRRGGAHG